jgi:hypothetical protein
MVTKVAIKASALLAAFSSVIGLGGPSRPQRRPLSPENAAGHMGETATACALVASAEHEANELNQPTLLDLGNSYPNAIFTAVIYGENRAKFGTPETSLRGKRICVTGKSAITRGSRRSS